MSKRNRPRKTSNQKEVIDQAAKLAPKNRIVSTTDNDVTSKQTVNVELRVMPIMIGLPMDEVLFSKFISPFLLAGIMPWDSLAFTESTYLPHARNKVHDAFIDSGLPYLFMVDSDVLLPPWTIPQLLAHKKDLVGGWYRQKTPKDIDGHKMFRPTVYSKMEILEDGFPYFKSYNIPQEGLVKVAGIGAGCLMMSRKLALALGKSPYHTNYGVGEDMVMCKKVTDLDFEIYVDWELACPHVGVSYV